MLGLVVALAVAASIAAWYVVKRRKRSRGSNKGECSAFKGNFVDLVKVTYDKIGCVPEKSSYARFSQRNRRKVHLTVKLIKYRL